MIDDDIEDIVQDVVAWRCSGGKCSTPGSRTSHMSDDNEAASHSDSSAATSSVSSRDDKEQQKSTERLDVDHMYSDQSQDGQTRSRTTVIRDIVKVITFSFIRFIFVY